MILLRLSIKSLICQNIMTILIDDFKDSLSFILYSVML